MDIQKLITKLESLKVYSSYSDGDNEVHLEKDPHGNLIKSEDLNDVIEKAKKAESKRISEHEKLILEVKETFSKMEKMFSEKYMSTQSAINDTSAIIEYSKLKGDLSYKINKL